MHVGAAIRVKLNSDLSLEDVMIAEVESGLEKSGLERRTRGISLG